MTANIQLKLKGKKLYRGEEVVASVYGCREHTHKFGIVANFWVIYKGETVATGFCYFKDAVQWAKSNVPAMLEA